MKNAYKNLPEQLSENSDMAQEYKFQQEKIRLLKEKQKKRRLFITGITVIIFSVIGFASLMFQGVSFISGKIGESEKEAYKQYTKFLIPVTAIDPEPFDDVTKADMEELIEISVWSIIGSGLDPQKYDYSSGELAVPVPEVEEAFRKYFSPQLEIKHCTVTGYGYEFRYNQEKNVYFIPLTTIEPLYTPEITDIKTKGGTTVISLGLINSAAFMQNSETGDIERPEPDKNLKITLREYSGVKYISSVQTSSLPEKVIVDVFTSAPENVTESETEENPTE